MQHSGGLYAIGFSILLAVLFMNCSPPPETVSEDAPEVTDSSTQEARVDFINRLTEKAGAEVERFKEAGGEPDDPEHPARQWADLFWLYREGHPETPAAESATIAAIFGMLEIEQLPEIYDKARSVPADDPVWSSLGAMITFVAVGQEDVSTPIEVARQKLKEATTPEAISNHKWMLGANLLRAGQGDEARAVFDQLAGGPEDWAVTQDALAYLYELDHLQVGMEPPDRQMADINGGPVSLRDFRGHPLLIVYWASW